MDCFTSTESRWICSALTAIIALLAACRSSRRRELVLWIVIAIGAANIFFLIDRRLAHTNLAHYYLGAKHPVSYFDFYQLAAAGAGKPQVLYRDLRDPDRLFRADPREQRLYYVGLLRESGIGFPASAATGEIEELCRSHGLFAREADAILNRFLPPDRVADYRDDVGRMNVRLNDFGFNGSPLYVLLRRLDPSLHRPFGPAVCYVNLAWQLLSLCLTVILLGRGLGWSREDALLALALMLASWDYTGWALNGLISGGWMLPVALALWGFRRRNPWLAGLGIAWAGLLRLFPFVLLLPLGIVVFRGSFTKEKTALAWKSILACLLSSVLLGWAAASFSGYSWREFMLKIGLQFHSAGFLNNGIGLSSVLLTLGIHKSLILFFPQLVVTFAIAWILWMRRPEDGWARLPETSLVLLGCLAWLTQTWFNYYSVIALFLVPMLLRRSGRLTVVLLWLLAGSYGLPDYGQAFALAPTVMKIVKIVPQLFLPLVALAVEIRDIKASQLSPAVPGRFNEWLFRREQPILLAGVALSALTLCAGVYVRYAVATYADAGEQFARDGRWEDARLFYRKALRLNPRSEALHFKLGAVLEAKGDIENAAAEYWKAVELNPEAVDARNNLGVLLMQKGRAQEAFKQFVLALAARPYDEELQVNVGQALLALGDAEEARTCFQAALDIHPGFEPALRQLNRELH